MVALLAEGGRAVNLVPLTIPQANEMVARYHRHHAPLPGGFAWWAVGVVKDGKLVGAALAGRPTNRNNADGKTVEVQRVVSDGTPHVCSMLLGACARAAKAIGAARVITYTLDDETGASLRGAGWVKEEDGITSWWHRGMSRTPAVARAHMDQTKTRWSVAFPGNACPDFELPPVDDDERSAQLFLVVES